MTHIKYIRSDPRENLKNIFIDIIKNCFDATIKYANTKRQYLINQGTVMNSSMFQQYLYNTHRSLDVNKWINQEKQKRANSLNIKYPAIGPEIMHQLRHKLHSIESIMTTINHCIDIDSKNETENKTESEPVLKSIDLAHDLGNLNGSVSQRITPDTDESLLHFTESQSTNISNSLISIPSDLHSLQLQHNTSNHVVNHQMIHINNQSSMGITGYGAVHGVSSTVSGTRILNVDLQICD